MKGWEIWFSRSNKPAGSADSDENTDLIYKWINAVTRYIKLIFKILQKYISTFQLWHILLEISGIKHDSMIPPYLMRRPDFLEAGQMPICIYASELSLIELSLIK